MSTAISKFVESGSTLAIRADMLAEQEITPDLIRLRCEEIQATWDEDTRQQRLRGREYTDEWAWRGKEAPPPSDLRGSCSPVPWRRRASTVPNRYMEEGYFDNFSRAYEDMYEWHT